MLSSKILFFSPILFGVFFILVPYNDNFPDITITDVIPVFFIFLSGIAIFSLIMKKIIKDNSKSFLISTLVTVAFFIYIPIHTSLLHNQIVENETSGHIVLLPGILISLLVILFFLIKSKNNFENIQKISFVIALSLVFFNIGEITYYSGQSGFFTDNSIERFSVDHGDLRDVYHILLDEHASTAVLKQYFNYDNSDFENFLKEKGFFIPEFSFSNYYDSSQSHAAILNMDYIDSISNKPEGTPQKELDRIIGEMLRESSVVKNFERNGYEVIAIHNEYDPDVMKNSIKVCKSDIRNLKILFYYVDSTPLKIFKDMIFSALDKTSNSEQEASTLQPVIENRICAFNELSNMRKNFSHPMFVYAHLIMPHGPYIFDSKGDIVYNRALSDEEIPPAYLAQLQYTDIKIQEIVEELLDSEPTPIIIIQSDHGVRFQVDEKVDPLKHSFLNFGAYYFPDKELDKDEYSVITPVNTFRMLFNEYFGTDYELLENRSFLRMDIESFNRYEVDNSTKFYDVTDFVMSNRIFEKDQ